MGLTLICILFSGFGRGSQHCRWVFGSGVSELPGVLCQVVRSRLAGILLPCLCTWWSRISQLMCWETGVLFFSLFWLSGVLCLSLISCLSSHGSSSCFFDEPLTSFPWAAVQRPLGWSSVILDGLFWILCFGTLVVKANKCVFTERCCDSLSLPNIAELASYMKILRF